MIRRTGVRSLEHRFGHWLGMTILFLCINVPRYYGNEAYSISVEVGVSARFG